MWTTSLKHLMTALITFNLVLIALNVFYLVKPTLPDKTIVTGSSEKKNLEESKNISEINWTKRTEDEETVLGRRLKRHRRDLPFAKEKVWNTENSQHDKNKIWTLHKPMPHLAEGGGVFFDVLNLHPPGRVHVPDREKMDHAALIHTGITGESTRLDSRSKPAPHKHLTLPQSRGGEHVLPTIPTGYRQRRRTEEGEECGRFPHRPQSLRTHSQSHAVDEGHNSGLKPQMRTARGRRPRGIEDTTPEVELPPVWQTWANADREAAITAFLRLRRGAGNSGHRGDSKSSPRFVRRRLLSEGDLDRRLPRGSDSAKKGLATTPYDFLEECMQVVFAENGTMVTAVPLTKATTSNPIKSLSRNHQCMASCNHTFSATTPQSSTTDNSLLLAGVGANSRTIEVGIECPYCHRIVEVDLLQPKKSKGAQTLGANSVLSQSTYPESKEVKACSRLKQKVKTLWDNLFNANETSGALQDPDVNHFRAPADLNLVKRHPSP